MELASLSVSWYICISTITVGDLLLFWYENNGSLSEVNQNNNTPSRKAGLSSSTTQENTYHLSATQLSRLGVQLWFNLLADDNPRDKTSRHSSHSFPLHGLACSGRKMKGLTRKSNFN